MTAWLIALTPEAQGALRGEQRVLDHLPFKVGRESRSASRRAGPAVDRRSGQVAQLNDLYIVEDGEVVNVSREHFLIERAGDGCVLIDRGSAGGTLVEGRRVGGDRAGGRAELHDHDVIIVGTSHSPFIFKFRLG
jgi:pSer/pThr/pTyr-binding forkhead associated (FHA) protein